MQALKTLQICLSLLPATIDCIRKMESLFPEPGQGVKKLQILRGYIEATYKTVGDVGVAFEEIWPVLNSGINAMVSGLNAIGLFQKTSKSTQADE